MAKLKFDRTISTETDDRKTKIVAANTIVGAKTKSSPQIIEDDTNTGTMVDEPEEASPPPPVGVASPTS